MERRAKPQGQSVEAVSSWIRSGIRNGTYSPGQRLIAAEISSTLGVSLGVVREALATLDGARLVEVQPNRGALVRPLDAAALTEIYEVRMALEGQAAALAARHIDAQGRKALRAAQAAADKAARSGDVRTYRETNHALHQQVLGLARNGRLAEMASDIGIPIHQRQLVLLLDREAMRRSNAEHQGITDAILAADEALAQRLMALHIANSCEALLALPELRAPAALG